MIEGGILLDVRVTTRAARDGIDGIGVLSDGRAVTHVRVRAVPSDGAANRAVCALVAKSLRRPKSAVVIAAGATARIKRLRVEGSVSDLAARIGDWPLLSQTGSQSDR